MSKLEEIKENLRDFYNDINGGYFVNFFHTPAGDMQYLIDELEDREGTIKAQEKAILLMKERICFYEGI